MWWGAAVFKEVRRQDYTDALAYAMTGPTGGDDKKCSILNKPYADLQETLEQLNFCLSWDQRWVSGDVS